MDFLTLMKTLFDLQDKFPDLRWEVGEGVLTLNMHIGAENEKLLRDGRRMMEPV